MIWVLPAVAIGVATVLGVQLADRPKLDWRVIAGAVAWCVAVLAIAVPERDPEVTDGAFAEGLVLCALLVGVVPYAAYYALGRLLARKRVALGVVWVLSVAPFYYYLFIAWLIVLDRVACGPDDYECPV